MRQGHDLVFCINSIIAGFTHNFALVYYQLLIGCEAGMAESAHYTSKILLELKLVKRDKNF